MDPTADPFPPWARFSPEDMPMDFLSQLRPRWPWSASLGGVSPDPTRTYRVAKIAGSFARERCREAGIVPGTRVRPRVSSGERVVVALPDDDGRLCSLEITYAWYIRIEPETPRGALPGTPSRPRLQSPQPA